MADDPNAPPAGDPPASDPPATDPPASDPPASDPPAADPPAADPPPAEGAWRSDLPDELRDFAKKFTSPTDAVRSAYEGQVEIGRRIKVPGEDASEEEKAEFRAKLGEVFGIPKTPEEYQIQLADDIPDELKPQDEASKAIQSDFLKTLHEAGATNGVVNAAQNWFYKTLGAQLAGEQADRKKVKEDTEARLRQEWGGDYERNVKIGERIVAEMMGGEESAKDLLSLELKDGSFLGAHGNFLRFAATAGRRLLEHNPLLGQSEEEAADVQKRIDEIHKLPSHEYKTDKVQEELRGLYAKLHGSQPVVGEEGRTV